MTSDDKNDDQQQSRVVLGDDKDEEDPIHTREKRMIINGEEVTVIEEDDEPTPLFSNLCLISKNGWNLEVWTDGSVTEPAGPIEIGLRLTRPSGDVKSATKGHVFVQLNGLVGQPSFKDEFVREFTSVHRKSLGLGDPEEFGRAGLTKPPDGWEASIKNPFPAPDYAKASAVKALGRYSLKVHVRLEDGTQFVSPPLPIEVVSRQELRHPRQDSEIR